jgi:hypothetical protein
MITQVQEYTGNEFQDLKQALLRECRNRLSVCGNDDAFVFAAILDARQKFFVFEDGFREKFAGFLAIPELCTAKSKFISEMKSPNYDYVASVGPSQESVQRNPAVVSSSHDEILSFMNVQVSTHQENSITDEFQGYIAEQRSSLQPLQYWKQHGVRFPRIAAIARRYLSIPASSSDVERLFSVAGALQRARRASLCCSTIEDLLLYRDYRLHELTQNGRTTVAAQVRAISH